ncbi:gamma-tubulin complex component protein [Artemisia annua]|uniref:Gamma-tubulin complex component n=1 Tax=Artemisia annua TaxID=35608 RepID=A0A2U1NUP8_ARTAN|nr:gamma-tubulin complex component protein [Artemisia annua]
MTPSNISEESSISNSIKTHLAKQAKLSDALAFADLYANFASETSIKNKHSLLYLLKLISENRTANATFGTTNASNVANGKMVLGGLRNGGVLRVSREGDCKREKAFRELVNEESDVTEECLVSDVLCVCEGRDGKYVKFDDNVDGYVVVDGVKVARGVRVMVRKLCELGWLFRKVNEYVLENGEKFAVAKAFCVGMEDELLEYGKLMRVLRSQMKCLTLRRLGVWFVEPMVKMRRMAVLVDVCKDLKGGAMAGAIHMYAQHGDPLLRDFMKRLLHKVSSPLFEMVRGWVLEGELRDLHSEFFVSEQSVKAECMWTEGYQINYVMLPSFISKSLANKILRTGKSINFLRVCCEDDSWASLATEAAASVGTTPSRFGLGYGETNVLESLVTEASKRIDKHLMHAIFTNYKFKEHCVAIKRFLLLGQGDFVKYLMEIVEPVLSEPAKTISKIHLAGLLEKAILSSSAQHNDSDSLHRLKVKMMPHKAGDTGWDVFSLDYHAGVPLNTVFSEPVMGNYFRIFNFLWRLRRVEHAVLGVWKTMKPNLITSHFYSKLPKAVRLQIVLTSRRCQVLWDEINHFVINLQSYIMLEVLEVTWCKFNNEMEAAKDLDDLIAAHDKYLTSIVEKSLLGESSEALYKTLLMLFDVISRFTNVATRLFEGIYEFRTRSTKSKTKEGKSSKSKVSETDPWLNEGRKAITQRAGEFLNNVGQDLDALSKEYASILKGFISQLPNQQHIDLKFLMFRLDFTHFYSLTA